MTEKSEAGLRGFFLSAKADMANDPQRLESIVNLLYSSVALFKFLGQRKYHETVVRLVQHPSEAVRTKASLCIQELRE
jgi:hypothetical protein